MKGCDLITQGVAELKRTAQGATDVAHQLIADHWPALDEDVRRSLAGAGLAKMISDELAAERGREIDARRKAAFDEEERREEEERARRAAEHEEWKRREEERRKQEEERGRRAWQARSEENRQRWEWNKKVQTDEALRQEVTRLHGLSGCRDERCAGSGVADAVYAQAACLGDYRPQAGYDPLRPQGLDAVIAFLRLPAAEREAAARRMGEVRGIHDQLKCRERCEPLGYADILRCVQQHVFSYPEGEWPLRIKQCRAVNQQREADSLFFRIGADRGYRLAVANLRSILLAAADGSMKSLLDFTRGDVQLWRKKARAQARSWRARAEWFAEAERLLGEAEAQCILDLPPQQIAALAERAEAVWKKKAPAAAAD